MKFVMGCVIPWQISRNCHKATLPLVAVGSAVVKVDVHADPPAKIPSIAKTSTTYSDLPGWDMNSPSSSLIP